MTKSTLVDQTRTGGRAGPQPGEHRRGRCGREVGVLLPDNANSLAMIRALRMTQV